MLFSVSDYGPYSKLLKLYQFLLQCHVPMLLWISNLAPDFHAVKSNSTSMHILVSDYFFGNIVRL